MSSPTSQAVTPTDEKLEDTRLLDWLESKGCIELEVYRSGRRPEFCCVAQGDHELGRGPTLRDAIRASMKEHPE